MTGNGNLDMEFWANKVVVLNGMILKLSVRNYV